MADYELDAYQSRFLRTVLRPLANTLLGQDATIDVGVSQWQGILADLTAASVDDDDRLVPDDSQDGSGVPTFGEVKSVVTLLGQLETAIKARMDELSTLHTHITLPQ